MFRTNLFFLEWVYTAYVRHTYYTFCKKSATVYEWCHNPVTPGIRLQTANTPLNHSCSRFFIITPAFLIWCNDFVTLNPTISLGNEFMS